MCQSRLHPQAPFAVIDWAAGFYHMPAQVAPQEAPPMEQAHNAANAPNPPAPAPIAPANMIIYADDVLLVEQGIDDLHQ
jgi:hypothetical protein